MLFKGSALEAEARRRPATIDNIEIGEFFDYFDRDLAASLADGGEPAQGMDCSQAYLVVQRPHTTIAAHFHLVDQLQVVIQGGGLIGRHPLRDIVVHYSNAHTTYGPIVAADEGVSYFTLRNCWDRTRAHPMPKSRSELEPGKRRHILLDPFSASAEAELLAVDGGEATMLLAPDTTGLGVWRYRAAPGAHIGAAPAPASGGGQYWLILGGAIARSKPPLSSRSCLFATPDHAPCVVAAGSGGLDLLIYNIHAIAPATSSPAQRGRPPTEPLDC